MIMSEKKFLNIISVVVLILQAAVEALAVVSIWQLDVLPNLYLGLLVAVMVLLLAITAVILFVSFKQGKTPGIVRRLVAVVMVLVISLGCALVVDVMIDVRKAMQSVTDPNVVTSILEVYVLTGDSAKNLKDTAGYTFAVLSDLDGARSAKALAQIEAVVGKAVSVRNCESVVEAMDLLYNGTVQAMVVDSAYLALLEDFEIYPDYESEIRVLQELVIEEETTQPTETEPTETEPTETEPTETEPTETEPTATDPVETTKPSETAPPATRPDFSDLTTTPFVIYISGSDTRGNTIRNSRSDVNIVAVVNPVTKQILLINTPRDTMVMNSAGKGKLDKLTHCGIYGINCSINALEDLYAVDINYYAHINFSGFEKFVNSIGGIDVESPISFTMNNGKYSIKKGVNHLNGKKALWFARERKGLPNGDYDRGKNQMRLIQAVVKKLTTSTAIANYSAILDSLDGMFRTSFSFDDISKLVRMQITDMAEWEVHSFAITCKSGRAITYSMPGYYLSVGYPTDKSVAQASKLIDKVLAGKKITSSDLK